jgi:hypothetical protein
LPCAIERGSGRHPGASMDVCRRFEGINTSAGDRKKLGDMASVGCR